MTALERLRAFRESRWWSLALRPLLFLVLSVVVARFVVSLVGSVDWSVGTLAGVAVTSSAVMVAQGTGAMSDGSLLFASAPVFEAALPRGEEGSRRSVPRPAAPRCSHADTDG